jgi:hypothetical protein
VSIERTVTVICDEATCRVQVTALTSTAARFNATHLGWQVDIRQELALTSRNSPRFTIRDHCPAHHVHALGGIVRLEQPVAPSLPHVQRAVLANLCSNPASKWVRLKELDNDKAHGAIAALVTKGWAEFREAKRGAKVRAMREYRATKAGRAALEAAP